MKLGCFLNTRHLLTNKRHQIINRWPLLREKRRRVEYKMGHTAGAGRWFGKNCGHSRSRGQYLGGHDYIPLLVPFPLEKYECCVIKNVNLFFHHPSFNKFSPFFFVTLFSEHCLDPSKIPGESRKVASRKSH